MNVVYKYMNELGCRINNNNNNTIFKRNMYISYQLRESRFCMLL
jgi:hypothetical protein